MGKTDESINAIIKKVAEATKLGTKQLRLELFENGEDFAARYSEYLSQDEIAFLGSDV